MNQLQKQQVEQPKAPEPQKPVTALNVPPPPRPITMQPPPPTQNYQPYPQQQYQPYQQQYPPQQYQMPQPVPGYQQPYYAPQPVTAQPAPPAPRTFITPEEAELVDIRNIQLDPDKLYQIYVGGLPSGVTDAELREQFSHCGDIKNIHLHTTKNLAFINYARKEGAMNALAQRDFYVRNEKLTLAGFHKKLQIILRRIPPQVSDEKVFQRCIQGFLRQKYPDIFVYSQLHQAQFGSSAYLHFLSKEDSINAFEALKGPDFTKAAIKELAIVQDPDNAIVVSNEEVDRRTKLGQPPNQNLEREVLQFLCVRYVEKQAQPMQMQQQQYQPPQQIPQYQQHYVQPQYGVQQQQQYGAYPQYQQQVNIQQPSRGPQSETSVYVRAMPFGTQQADVMRAMSQFGQVQAVSLINTMEAQGKPPCAIVHFAQRESVGIALQAGSVVINGQNSGIQPHVHKKK